jgi:hypothetical protein
MGELDKFSGKGVTPTTTTGSSVANPGASLPAWAKTNSNPTSSAAVSKAGSTGRRSIGASVKVSNALSGFSAPATVGPALVVQLCREGTAEGRELVRRPRRQRELRAIMRAAIAEELRALYRVRQDEPLPERLTDLVRQLDSRNDGASPGEVRRLKWVPSRWPGGILSVQWPKPRRPNHAS